MVEDSDRVLLVQSTGEAVGRPAPYEVDEFELQVRIVTFAVFKTGALMYF